MRVRAALPGEYGWLCQSTGYAPASDFRAIVAVDEATGRIEGLVGYDHWMPNSVHMHVRLASPACRGLVRAAFEYPFQQVGCGVALGFTPAHCGEGVRLAKRLGFREAYRIREGWAVGVDTVVFEMRREECRWLSSETRKVA